MDIHIDEAELRLLTYLHEHHVGTGKEFIFGPEDVARDLGVDVIDLVKPASYLSEHKLAGASLHSRGYAQGEPQVLLNWLWLTGLGEDYMRALEHEPGIGRKITVAVLKEAKGLILATAGTVLADFMKRFVAPQA